MSKVIKGNVAKRKQYYSGDIPDGSISMRKAERGGRHGNGSKRTSFIRRRSRTERAGFGGCCRGQKRVCKPRRIARQGH